MRKRFNLLSLSAVPLVLLLSLGTNTSAQPGPDVLEQRLKTSLNTMVRHVREAETPEAKRRVMERFVGKARAGTLVAKRLPFLTVENREALTSLQARFEGYALHLEGEPGTPRAGIADTDLDAYASYMQQDLEQASGGLFLSTGVIIIILLIVLILL